MKTGVGDFSDATTNHTLLTGHTANLPASTVSRHINRGDEALTYFPFWVNSTYHWGISQSLGRWECDDYANSSSQDTYHQVWVR